MFDELTAINVVSPAKVKDVLVISLLEVSEDHNGSRHKHKDSESHYEKQHPATDEVAPLTFHVLP